MIKTFYESSPLLDIKEATPSFHSIIDVYNHNADGYIL